MANKILTYTLLFLVLCFLGLGIWGYFKYQKQGKQLREVTAERDYCWKAPVVSDTARDSIIVNGRIWMKPKEVSRFEIDIKIQHPAPIVITKLDTVHDSIPAKFCEKYFADAYQVISNKDTGVINYAIHVKDCEAQIMFPRIRLPKEIITYTKTVDTCLFKEPVKQSLSHLWLYFKPGMIVSPFQVSNVTTGLQYTRKNKWGIGAGIGYDWNINSPVADVTFLINLK